MDGEATRGFLQAATLVVWIGVPLLVFGVWCLANAVFDAQPDERIAIYRGDRVHRVRGPGLVLKWPLFEGLARIDMRPRKETVKLPAIRTATGAWIAATLHVGTVVLQPEKAAEVARMRYIFQAIAELVETAFREVAATLPPERMVEPQDRAHLGRSVKKVANETALGWGIDITSVEVADFREIAAPAEGASNRWQVVLEAAGANPISVIRVVRESTGLGLKEAKEFVEAAPRAIPGFLGVEAASKLRHHLEVVGATASLAIVAPAADGEAVAPAGELVDVMLRATGERVIEVIKVLRRVTGWELAHAKAVVEQAPYAIMHRVARRDAEEVRRELEAAGATVELV